MAYSGFVKPTNKIVVLGDPQVQELKAEAATNMYAGRLVMKGTNDDDCVVADGSTYAPIGWLGFEHGYHANARPATVDTIYVINAMVPVLYGGDFVIVGSQYPGCAIRKGDTLVNFGAAGQLVPGRRMFDGIGVRIPFTKNASEADTGFDLPAGMIVKDCLIEVTTNVASSTIDVGILSTEGGGDADGFVDGESCATAGFVDHIDGDTTEANNTLGALLVQASVKSADASAKYFDLMKPHICDGTAMSVSYTTSSHDVAGNIWLILEETGMNVVARAEQSQTTTTTAADIMVTSLI